MASWEPDQTWAERRIDVEHRADDNPGLMTDLWNDQWEARYGKPPVIPGGRQVPVVYREPLAPKYFHSPEATVVVVSAPTLFGEQSCPKCSGKLDDDSYCNFCGHLGAAA